MKLLVVILILFVSVDSLARNHLVGNKKIRLSSGFGKRITSDTVGFLCYDCLSGFLPPALIEKLYEQTSGLMRNNPTLVNRYYQLLVAASDNQQLTAQFFSDFAQLASRKLYRPLQKLDRSSLFDHELLTTLIDHRARVAYDKNRIIGLAQGQRVSEILTTVRQSAKKRSNVVDLIALDAVIKDFSGYQKFESQLPDEDAAQVLAVVEGRKLDRALIQEVLIKINEREDRLAELGIALRDALDAHNVEPSRFEPIVTSLFSAKSDPVVIVNAEIAEMTQQGIIDGQQALLSEHLQYLRDKELMIIKRLTDQLQIEIMYIDNNGEATIITSNKIDGNTLFKDNRIALAEAFSQQRQKNPLNLGSDVPFSITWSDLVVEEPTPYYLLAKLALAMSWGEADLAPLLATNYKEIIKLLTKEKSYHLDNPAKLAALETFIDSYPRSVNRLFTVSTIYKTMEDHQWTISEQPSPYLNDYSPSQILTLAKKQTSYYEHLHAVISVEDLIDIDWYRQNNLNRLVELFQKHQLMEHLTTIPSYQKIFSQQEFTYRDYLQLQMELEDLLRELPRSHDLYSAIAMLPRTLHLEQLANSLTETGDLTVSLAKLWMSQIIADELPTKQIQANLQEVVGHERQPLPSPTLVNDQPPTVIPYLKPHWLQNRAYRQPSSVNKKEVSVSKEPGLVSLQNLGDDLSPSTRLEEINKILDMDLDNLIAKMNKHRKRVDPRHPVFDQQILIELLEQQRLNRKKFQTANRYLQAIEGVYQRQIPSINFETDRRKGRDKYKQEIGRQLQLIREELRRRHF